MNNKNNDKRVRKIETNGVEQIPDHERTAGPKDLFRLIFGAANTFATAVLGAFPVLFGLGTATIVAIKAPDYIATNNYVGGLLAVAPSGFFLPVCLIAVIGGMSTGTTSRYGTGLDRSRVFPEPAAVYGPTDPRSKRTDARVKPALQPAA